MGILSNFFNKKESPILTNKDFWNWFLVNEKTFYNTVKSGNNIENDFFSKLAPKLEELKEGYFYLTGMFDDSTAELILTADGDIPNIVFVEDLVKEAPNLSNWKFTALKPAHDIENVSIKISNYIFDKDNLSFYSTTDLNYPDEVEIVIVYNNYNEADKKTITNGVYLFIDNYLCELNSVTTIDSLTIISKEDSENELIPIAKLKDYLIWREKEFVEKYEGIRHNTDDDTYSTLTANLKSGLPLIAMVNTSLIEWENKASHPWILKIEIEYDGSDYNGLPDGNTSPILNEFEDKLMLELKDIDGYLNVGRQSAENKRIIYFACKEFRKPSKVLYNLIKQSIIDLEISYDIYKDKYWQSLEKFNPN